MVGDDTCLRILEQYTNFVENITDNGPSLSMAETAYQKKIEGLVGDDNCYKITMVSILTLPVVGYWRYIS